MRFIGWLTTLGICLGLCPVYGVDQVNESAREIPLAYEADVVVVGGGTGAVAAAVAAAEDGAKVFLAAPHPYLGEDMTATLQLWLEPGERPTTSLAKQVYADPLKPTVDPNRLSFTYESSAPSDPIHRDTTPPSLLTDGKWGNASNQSVQYGENAEVIADLDSTQEIREVRLMVFRRAAGNAAGNPFDVQRVTVSLSDDRQTWRPAAVIENDLPMGDVVTLAAACEGQARYVKFFVEKPAEMERLLLGEIEIVGPQKDRAAQDIVPPMPRPMHVKVTLDQALLDAGVTFLYSCYATDVLRDDAGEPCGIVMANRAGRQAVVAKIVIDATHRAVIARQAGVPLRATLSEDAFKRVVIGGPVQQSPGLRSRTIEPPFVGPKGTFPVIEYTLDLDRGDGTYGDLMRADQQARSVTYHPEQQFTSDELWNVPTEALRGAQSTTGIWSDLDSLPEGVFRPADTDRIYVLSGYADVSRQQARVLMRPVQQMAVGERIGHLAAKKAKSLPQPRQARLAGKPTDRPVANGDVQESLSGVRPTQSLASVAQDVRALPVLGKYDVVVIGGGTGGAPAGIGAARRGAKTLVVEYLHGLGGVGTLGAIAGYYWGDRVGFTATILDGSTRWEVEPKMEWYRRQLLEAGADIWFGSIGCGAFVEKGRVKGAVVATPDGRGVVLAETVIDATGNSDIAAAAGAETIYTDATEFGMQGTGLPGRKLGGAYNNTDFTIVDESDMVDVWHVFVYSKGKYPNAFDHGQLIDTRERRRIVGDFVISLTDQINLRTHPDSVVRCWSNFDTHGYTVDPYLLLEHPEKVGVGVYIPLRAMLPRGIEGLMVTGLSISAQRDAIPLIRMQADIQNGGYAAGVAAAMAANYGIPVREIDVKNLQQHLVDIGNLPENVLTDQDSYPLSDERIATAVESFAEGQGAAVIMAAPDRALPLLQRAYDQATGDAKLAYAKALAVLGDDRGLTTLTRALEAADAWDAGWNYRGMGQFGAALSHLDALTVALGRTGNAQAIPTIREKIRQLDAASDFSHHRAVGLALELIGEPAAAEDLAELLRKPGMTGFVHLDVATAKERGVPGGTNAEQTRRESLRELLLARALYRCGDCEGLGEEILRQYTRDLRGHLARHASAVLEEKAKAHAEAHRH